MGRKLTIEEVRNRLNRVNSNILLLEDTYINNRTNMKCKCKICNYV